MTTEWTTVAAAAALNDRHGGRLYRMRAHVRSLGPYLAVAVMVPGGSALAALLWLRAHRKEKL